MKKLVSIGLLLVFLFNVVGYRIFFYYLEKAADARIQARLDALPDDDLITVKIPINLPYQIDWQHFEPADGEVAVDGTVYRYVKQKVYRDTLILMCVNDREKSTIQKNSSDFFKRVNDLTAESSKKPTLKQTKTDFFQDTRVPEFALYAVFLPSSHLVDEFGYFPGFIRQIKTPPRLAAVPC